MPWRLRKYSFAIRYSLFATYDLRSSLVKSSVLRVLVQSSGSKEEEFPIHSTLKNLKTQKTQLSYQHSNIYILHQMKTLQREEEESSLKRATTPTTIDQQVVKKRKLSIIPPCNYIFNENTKKVATHNITIDSLNDDTLYKVLEFVGMTSYMSFGRVNKMFHNIFLMHHVPTKTFLYGYAPIDLIIQQESQQCCFDVASLAYGVVLFNRDDILEWCFEQQDKYKLEFICIRATQEGRIDMLNKIFLKVDISTLHFLRSSSVGSCYEARGDSDTLCWLQSHGCVSNEDSFSWFLLE